MFIQTDAVDWDYPVLWTNNDGTTYLAKLVSKNVYNANSAGLNHLILLQLTDGREEAKWVSPEGKVLVDSKPHRKVWNYSKDAVNPKLEPLDKSEIENIGVF